MYKKLLISTVFATAAVTAFAQVPTAPLVGDTKLACEAILCLASSARPPECKPSLDRYHGIRAKRMSDIVRKRINFLKLCPVGPDPLMATMISAIAHGAGFCSAENLNATGGCSYSGIGESGLVEFTTRQREGGCVPPIAILPKHCQAYGSHPYIKDVLPVYVGAGTNYAGWVKPEDAAAEQAAIDRRVAEDNARDARENRVSGHN